MAWTRVSTFSWKKNSPWQMTRLASSMKAISLACWRAPPGAEHGVGLPELVGVFHAEGEAFLVVVVAGSEQFVFANEAVKGGRGDAVALQQSFFDAEPIQGAFVHPFVAEVGLGGVERFEQF